ncbi:MAG: SH3 domain-containing protein [Selenomonas artemidis]|nr:SH3 domain-containing protein [Selenomonas artemidis]
MRRGLFPRQYAVRLLIGMGIAGILVFGDTGSANAALPIGGAAADPLYWERADGDTPLLSAVEIAALNQRIAASTDSLHDLTAVPETLSGAQVRAYIDAAAQNFGGPALPELYAGKEMLGAEEWRAVRENRSYDAVPAVVQVRYAVAAQRTDVRLLPTAEGWYDEPGDVNYDALQGTVLDPGEAVLILHTSADGSHGFVMTRDYLGWVRMDHLARTDRRSWLRFADPEEYFTVTAASLALPAGDAALLYQLGARIPAGRGTERGLIPVRDTAGHLIVRDIPLPHQGLYRGALPPTRNHLIQLAFAPLGTEYGWGGLQGGMDCSSYVQNIYRAMGIFLPRDADVQEHALGQIAMTGGAEQRRARLGEMPPGTLLFRPGHVMLYLGMDRAGEPLVIHDISSYYEDGTKRYIRRVVASDLNFLNARGTAALDTLTHIGQVLP